MSIKQVVDSKLRDFAYRTSRQPEAIYMTREDIGTFSIELARFANMRDAPVLKCPHCGGSLFWYGGIEVREIKNGTVVIE